MSKIALITDTTADLSDDVIEKYNIHVLPFRIIYKDREYRDKFEITAEQVYDNFAKEIPTSSMPSLQDMEDLFDKLEEEGYTHAIAITLSSGLSGIYNGVRLVAENHPKITTYVYDSKCISLGEGAIVELCGELISKGKSFEEIVDELPNIRSRINLFFVVGTLEYLKKGGRIGKVAGTIGELLNIKPIISVDKNDGKYFTYDKVRGRKQSLNKFVNIAKEMFDKKRYKVYIMHGGALEEAKKVFETISKFIDNISITFGGSISPVSGVHTGPGLIGMVLLEEL